MEGLRSLLESAEGLRVVAVENSLEDGMDAARQLRPTVMFVDKAFGTDAVMDWVRALRAAKSPMATIVWSVSLSEAEALSFLQSGAAGVIRKTAPLAELMTCIRTVVAGCAWMDSDMAKDVERPLLSGRSALSARELQVTKLIEQGCRNKDIALALGIRPGTVKVHLKHIFKKTGIRGRYGLAISGLKEKLKEKGLLDEDKVA
jgi:two-component system nitrate/nitrite response regulator NarL